MTLLRTDIHRPSAILPEDYDFAGFEYLKTDDDIGMAGVLIAERSRIRAHMQRTGGTYSHHEHGGNCHICGAHCIYTALFYHRPTNTYIRTGLDCAEKLDCGGIEDFRKQVHTALEATAGKRKAKATLERDGLTAAWNLYQADVQKRGDFKVACDTWRDAGEQGEAPKLVEYTREEDTVLDIVGKLIKYGSISDKQVSFVRRLLDNIANRPQIEAQRKAETDAAKPVPVSEQRITVRGKVLTVRLPDAYTPFGATKILVQHADGWKVWGTLPSSLTGTKRGDEIEFQAAVKVSDKDTKFGFFARPSKAKVIKESE